MIKSKICKNKEHNGKNANKNLQSLVSLFTFTFCFSSCIIIIIILERAHIP
jgi:hypothetical protein